MRGSIAFLLTVLLTASVNGQKSEPLVLTHVTVIDMTGAPAKPEMTLVITGNRITAIGRSGEISLPENATVVDASGKFLIPGMVRDMQHAGVELLAGTDTASGYPVTGFALHEELRPLFRQDSRRWKR